MIPILFLIAVGVAYLYWNFHQNDDYWTRRGVKQPTVKSFPMGNNAFLDLRVLTNKINLGYIALEQYGEFRNERYYGTYGGPFSSPILVIKDPDLCKQILIKDFQHFVNRNAVIDFFGKGKGTTDLAWQKMLANIKGDDWKDVRSTFSPIFTSGKLKIMMTFINDISSRLAKEVTSAAEDGTVIDLKDKFGKFSMDTIASCAFGVDAGSFNEGESIFVQNARRVFKRTKRDAIMSLAMLTPVINTILGALKIPIFKPKETEFFWDVIVQTLRSRIALKNRRNDLIDMMVDALKDDLSDELLTNQHANDQFEKDSKLDHKAEKKELNEVVVVATAMVLMIAGYDTTATTMAYVGYELARHQDVQDRLMQEIDEAFDNTESDNLDYSVVQGLSYMDMVFHEALRLYTPISILARGCTKDYTIPGTSIMIHKGQEVHFNTIGIHHDDKYYENPEEFDPENFSKERKAQRHPYTFFAFGQGPRSCIGMRFALLEAKIGLIKILKAHRFVTCKETPQKLTRDPTSILGISKENVWVKVMPRF